MVTLLTRVGGAGSDVSAAEVLSSSTAFSSSAFFSGVTVVMRVPVAKAGLESFIKLSLLAMTGAGKKKSGVKAVRRAIHTLPRVSSEPL